ncbi:MAG: hypothetical protein SF052_19195 [Bacteroidia bacterium]|nr:hypothetical protein [Bacteroidia bacterium]
MKQPIVPSIIVGIMCLYVYGLTYHAEHRIPPDPSYDFYDTTTVRVIISGSDVVHDIYGRFNNILEGERQLVKARDAGPNQYKLTFQVNSPRPAVLFIDDEDLEIFLVPGDTSLVVDAAMNPNTYLIDSLNFEGTTSGICSYYKNKTNRFQKVHLRATRSIVDSEDFGQFCLQLDSMAARELGFLAEQEIFDSLPEWFVDFERTEILYQKAYLKLSRAYNRDIPDYMLDKVAIDNEAAVFSYYYYLYLTSYFSSFDDNRAEAEGTDSLSNQEQIFTESRIHLADSLLTGGPHDVFITRSLFSHLKNNQLGFVEKLFQKYKDSFYSKKYYRFIEMQLKERSKPI